MSFTYPLGLLALIGVPIIIVIYILQSKYNEQTVPSTYLWTLSEKFLKKRNPLSALTGLISLILQILTVVAIALAISRPVFVLPGAAKDYCFVLDASSSMSMQNGDKSRFELAKERIAEVIDDSKRGSSYTLIWVGSDNNRIFEGVTDKERALELLLDVEHSYMNNDYSDAHTAAQEYFDASPSSLIYLLTDKEYEAYENIEVIDVSGKDEENYAVFDVEYSHSGGKLKVSANVISYNSTRSLTARLYVDGTEAASATVNASKGERTPVSFECACIRFSSFKVELADEDGYALDNSIVTYNPYNQENSKKYSTAIVSETGFFFEAVIDALLDAEVVTMTPKQYENSTERYGLYIFDSYEPKALPDAAVWLINADENIADSGFGVRGKVNFETATAIEKSKNSATRVRALLESVDGSDIYISNYVKYSGMYSDFITLFSYESNPLIFAGSNALGNRQVVFGFDLHESDFALSTDFVMLARNLLKYSFPDVVDTTGYVVGEEALINIVANAENVKAIAPSGTELYIGSDEATASLLLEEVGTYVIKMTVSGIESEYSIYSGAHPDESRPNVTESGFSLSGERKYESIDGEYDPLTVIFICLAVLFIADWGVYCYEKYQLR